MTKTDKKIKDSELRETKNRLGIDTKNDITDVLADTKKDIQHDKKLLKILDKTLEMTIDEPKCLCDSVKYVRKSLAHSKRDLEVLTEMKKRWNEM